MGWEKFLRLTIGADRVGIWWTVLGPGSVLTALYTWIASHATALANAGWGAWVLTGVFFAALSMIAAAWFLPVWDRIRGRGVQAAAEDKPATQLAAGLAS